MLTLILIVQTYSSALAYEYGPYPDQESCEVYAAKHMERIKQEHSVLKIAFDCAVITPELQNLSANGE